MVQKWCEFGHFLTITVFSWEHLKKHKDLVKRGEFGRLW